MPQEIDETIELPCKIRSLNASRGARRVLIFLLTPEEPIAVWPSPADVTILKQSAANVTLKGTLRGRIVNEDEESYRVEIANRGKSGRIKVPKSWLERELGPS